MRQFATNQNIPLDSSLGSIRSMWIALRREKLAMYAILGYLLFEYVRPQSIYPWMDVFPFSAAFLFLSVLLAVRETKASYLHVGATWLIIVFTLVILLSSLAAYSSSYAFENFDIYLNWLLLYFAFVGIVNSPRRWVLAFAAFLLFSFKMSQHGFRVWVGRGMSFADWGLGGPPGWFHNSGELGIQMCIFLPLSIGFILAFRQHWGRLIELVAWMMPVTAVATIIGSSSRGAVLGGVASMVPLVVASKYRWKALGAAVLVVVVGFMVMPPEFLDRFSSAGEDRTSVTRLTRWKAGMDMMWDHPLLGVGYFNWPVYYPPTYAPGEEGAMLSHNIFVQAGSELGVTGLALFVAMIISCFSLTRRIRLQAKVKKEHDHYRHLAISLDGAMFGFLVSGFFVTVLYYPYFWVSLAFTVALYNVVRNGGIAATRPRKRAISAGESDGR